MACFALRGFCFACLSCSGGHQPRMTHNTDVTRNATYLRMKLPHNNPPWRHKTTTTKLQRSCQLLHARRGEHPMDPRQTHTREARSDKPSCLQEAGQRSGGEWRPGLSAVYVHDEEGGHHDLFLELEVAADGLRIIPIECLKKRLILETCSFFRK